VLGRRSLFLNKNVAELSRLQEIHEDLNRSQDLDRMLEQLAMRLGTIFSAESIVFLLLLEESPRIRFFSKLPVSEEFVAQCRKRLLDGVPNRRNGDRTEASVDVQLLVPDATEGRFLLREIRSMLRLQLQGREGPIGRLAFFSSMAGAFSQSDENLAAIIAGEIALALDRANWMRRTEILSITDELTGLFNHRRFLQIMEHEFGRAQRYKSQLCLLMHDIDRFKLLNDTYGHPQGDRMLKELAKILNATVRESDMVARYGGEEFAIVLPSTDPEGGKATAERIRVAVEKKSFPNPGNPPLRMTVSLGVANLDGQD
jgi:diguanylate cyclase (GGDEF)-like protein